MSRSQSQPTERSTMTNEHEDDTAAEGARKWKAVYTIVERNNPSGEKKSYFMRIGTCFTNRDGSYHVKLDAVPVNGTLHIRDPQPFDDSRPRGGNGAGMPSRD